MSEQNRTRTYQWANPLETAETAKEMSGYDFLAASLKKSVPLAPVLETLEFYPLSLEEGKVKFEFEPKEYHYNPIGSVHGGVISTVMDTVMGCAVQSKLAKGTSYTTLELKVNFIRAVNIQSGKLIAEGRIIHLGRTTALVEAGLKDEHGKVYAHGVSTCLIIKF